MLPVWMQTTSMRCSSHASYRGGQQKPAWFPYREFPSVTWLYQWPFRGFTQKIILPMCWWLQSRSFHQTAQRTIEDNNKLVYQSFVLMWLAISCMCLGNESRAFGLSPWWTHAGPLAMGPKWGRCRSIRSLLIMLHYYLVCSPWP